jgi:hypothetical protein
MWWGCGREFKDFGGFEQGKWFIREVCLRKQMVVVGFGSLLVEFSTLVPTNFFEVREASSSVEVR